MAVGWAFVFSMHFSDGTPIRAIQGGLGFVPDQTQGNEPPFPFLLIFATGVIRPGSLNGRALILRK